MFVCQSFAKNFGLYCERVGALHIVAADAASAAASLSMLEVIVRPMYSNPPAHGARIVSTILHSAELEAVSEGGSGGAGICPCPCPFFLFYCPPPPLPSSYFSLRLTCNLPLCAVRPTFSRAGVARGARRGDGAREAHAHPPPRGAGEARHARLLEARHGPDWHVFIHG